MNVSAVGRMLFSLVAAGVLTLSVTSAASAAPGHGVVGAAAKADAIYYTWENDASRLCLYENGTTSSVSLNGCSSNHSFFWTFSYATSPAGADYMVNYHSGLCLERDGSDHLIAATCNGNHAEWWYVGGGNGDFILIKNYHTGTCLARVSGSTLGMRTCNTRDTSQLWF